MDAASDAVVPAADGGSDADGLGSNLSPWQGGAMALADLAFVTDAEGRFLWLAPSRVLGYDAASLLGQDAVSLFATAAAAPFLTESNISGITFPLRDASGQTRHLLVSATPILDASGKNRGARGIGIEIARHGMPTMAPAQPGLRQPGQAQDHGGHWHWQYDQTTGLLTELAFLDEVSRRIERLDRESEPGTVLVAGLGKRTDWHGANAVHSELLLTLAELLRALFRPTDLMARLNTGDFAVWLDGCDQLTAAERAETLRRHAPHVLADVLDDQLLDFDTALSQAIATRSGTNSEPFEQVLARAQITLEMVRRDLPGEWRVAPEQIQQPRTVEI